MSNKQGAQICMVTLFDRDAEECGKAYSTVSGEVVLEWGYGDDKVNVTFDEEDVEAVIRALAIVTFGPATVTLGPDK